jgi:cellulose synthase/poly-beta-1,6-N-acetylglucosamine synthase-like glycosyltransferase
MGVHRVWLLAAFARRRPVLADPDLDAVDWPGGTVQLPLFNERFVVAELLDAVGRLDYPRDRLEIQVLDDSTDETTELARRGVADLNAAGVDAVLLHRTDRTGFKAGALAAGLDVARFDRVAVFDADFRPTGDFLRRTVPLLDAGAGMVQARWGHSNLRESWLTRVQGTLLDGHFVVEHTARHVSDRWFNFNGTAGIWRREAIIDGGGWQHDTLTEDLDLSYRAQLAGWRFEYLDDLVQPAELPRTMAAFKAQQHRWAKGSIQTAVKLLPRIWRSEAPMRCVFEATIHLTANLGYPLLIALALLMPWAAVARVPHGFDAVILLDLVLFGGAMLSVFAFYGTAVWHAGTTGRMRRILGLPVVLAVGIGLAVSQSHAVYRGLTGDVGVFVRTPKGKMGGYRARIDALVLIELGLGVYMLGAMPVVASQGGWAAVPFMSLFAAGFLIVGLQSLGDLLAARAERAPSRRVARRRPVPS